MDKLSKLQALLPEVKVSKTAESSPWTHYPKPTHLYEGTDSEDDEEIMRWGKMEQSQMSQSSWVPAGAETGGKAELLPRLEPLLNDCPKETQMTMAINSDLPN
jgi:hypothetical protein